MFLFIHFTDHIPNKNTKKLIENYLGKNYGFIGQAVLPFAI